jgi:multidrug resistance efflux pump
VSEKSTNIQQQIRGIRRVVLGLCLVASVVLIGMLLFVPIDERVTATGTVRAERDSHLYSPIDGVLKSVEAYEGDAVSKGDPILLIDDTELQDRLLQVSAAIEKAKVELDKRKATLERTTRLPLPKDFWHMQEELGMAAERIRHSEIELQRATELQKKGLVSKQELEKAQLTFELARSEESKTREKLRIVEAGLENSILDEAAAEINTAFSSLRELEVERDICLAAIERCVIRSPEDGTVTLIHKRRPGVGVSRGETLAHIAHGDATRVDVYCGENQYYRLAVGQRVLMRSNAFDTLRHGYIEGTVVQLAIEPETGVEEPGDATSAAGPKYRVVTKVESTPQKLVLGSTVEARIIIRRIPIWKLLLPDTLK